jgi:hypothetical protein
LFCVYVNDIVGVLRSASSLIFADDFKLFMRIENEFNRLQMQRDLDAVVSWGEKNNLTLNIKKCKVQRFTKKRKYDDFEYFVDNVKLEKVNIYKDLGVLVHSQLNFNNHIDSIVKRANMRLGCVVWNSKSFENLLTLVVLYTALVRSILEYCCQIWNPYYECNRARIERVQMKFVKYIFM